MTEEENISDLSDLLIFSLNDSHQRVMDQNSHLDVNTQVKASILAYSIGLQSLCVTLGIPKNDFLEMMGKSYDSMKKTFDEITRI